MKIGPFENASGLADASIRKRMGRGEVCSNSYVNRLYDRMSSGTAILLLDGGAALGTASSKASSSRLGRSPAAARRGGRACGPRRPPRARRPATSRDTSKLRGRRRRQMPARAFARGPKVIEHKL